ncbi:glycosyl transferase [Geotalea uraniireducens]|uniref:Glycosyl transferase n=1 Tax=Geotalea uraniireducens TaxID=351604 RepID=A0ABN6VSM3_9BACT|nr:glycosyltransferase family 2 protein [Geotalea uraniireducens]BDV43094.1 glycosyl transferase [Geotalea uraniireducens]
MLRDAAVVLLFLQPLILLYFLVLNGFYTLFTLVSLRDIRNYLTTVTSQSIDNAINGMFHRPLSILVPAHNEEKTIVSSVKSLLALRYPEYEVIVINDGSADGTLERLIDEFHLVRIDKPISLILAHQPIIAKYLSVDYPQLFVIDKKNGGKADALNAGINAAQYPLFCSIDADSVLENDALIRAARLFVEDREVIATGGIVRVLNGCEVEDGIVKTVRAPGKWLECFQTVEYTKGFLSGRTSWNYFHSLLIISGAFGIFRKDMAVAVGGYRKSVGEDMDLVVRLHCHCREQRIPYKVIFVPDPVCWTQVPSDLRSLLKQRNRWHRGLIDSLWHSRKMFLNPRFGMVGMFGFPYFVFVEAMGPAVELLGYFGFVVLFLLGQVNREFALLFFLLAVLWGTWINLGSILLDNLIYRRYGSLSDILKLCLFGVLEFFGYRQIIVIERLVATIFFWRKGWGKAARKRIDREEADALA